MHPTAAPAHVLRGAVVALVGLGVAAAAHVDGGATVALSPVTVLVALLVTAAAVLASRQQWTVPRLLAALVGMQVAAHVTLWFDGGSHAADPRLAAVAVPTHAHAHAATDGPTPGMLAAHLVAVAAGALLLAGLDAALVVLSALARRLVGAVVVRRPSPALRRVAVASRPSVRARILELGAVGRRGPPGAVAPC